MQDMQSLMEAYWQAKKSRLNVALATVVRVVGSAYRQPGARMLILEAGRTVGSISGGCLEQDVVLRSQEVIEGRRSALFQYHMSGSDDDIVFGVGSGCNGRIEILVEPIGCDGRIDSLSFLNDCASNRKLGVLATVLAVEETNVANVGEKMAVTPQGKYDSDLKNEILSEMIAHDAVHVLSDKSSLWRRYQIDSGAVEVFLELIEPPVLAVICGRQKDALALASIGKTLDWQVVMLNPQAAEHLLAEAVETIQRYPAKSAVVVMTHNYRQDLCFLRRFIVSDVAYVGLLGPKHRSQKLMQELLAEGIYLSEEQISRLYSPVGLDIGGSCEGTVALSIAAEINAVVHQRAGGLLRERQGAIHSRPDNQSLYLSSTDTILSVVGACPR